MKKQHNLSFLIVLLAIVTLTWFTACEDGVSVQDTPPQTVSQPMYSTSDGKANPSGIRPIEGQYIVVFHERWQEARTSQAAEEVRLFTDQFLRDVDIPADSVVARFELALRGFTARMDEAKAKALIDDPRVDYVDQDKWAQVISSFSHSEDTTITTTASQPIPWGISRVAGPLDGSGKRAWILDTGIDLNHADLAISAQHNISFIPGENANDLRGHGTHVAGIIAGKTEL
jgi:subtilisin family serine protease